MKKKSIWVTPRVITDLKDCIFYHTMDIPGVGLVKGPWDLRSGIQNYLGNVDFKGKKVLEIGTSSGFICFYMEKKGAEVVSYDVSDIQELDVVPYAGSDFQKRIRFWKEDTKKINNSYWLAHRAHKSRAKVVYGTVYEIPDNLGMFDITTFGSVLLHVRDPFLALQKGLKHTTDMVIITELFFRPNSHIGISSNLFQSKFLPHPKFINSDIPHVTWWALSPKLIKKYLAVLGFEKTKTNYHLQNYAGKKCPMFTIVGYRTSKSF